MRLAIIADIHSNLEALESVLDRIRQEGVESVLNLGDLVGYNASPNECLALLRSRPDIKNLAGNHDLALLAPERAEAFNIIAYQALMWCREQVPSDDLEFLQGLPLTLETRASGPATAPPPARTLISPTTSRANGFCGT